LQNPQPINGKICVKNAFFTKNSLFYVFYGIYYAVFIYFLCAGNILFQVSFYEKRDVLGMKIAKNAFSTYQNEDKPNEKWLIFTQGLR
jgi:hypothetical protein